MSITLQGWHVMGIHVMMEPVFLHAGSAMVITIVVGERMNKTAHLLVIKQYQFAILVFGVI